MADYTVVNSLNTQLTNVNVGGIDVPKRSIRHGITLTDAELAAVCALTGVAVLKNSATSRDKREVARVLKYRKVATGAAL